MDGRGKTLDDSNFFHCSAEPKNLLKLKITDREAKSVQDSLDVLVDVPPPYLRGLGSRPFVQKIKKRLASRMKDPEDMGTSEFHSKDDTSSLKRRPMKKDEPDISESDAPVEKKWDHKSSDMSSHDDSKGKWKGDPNLTTVSFSKFILALKKSCGARAQIATKFRSSVILAESVCFVD